MTLFIHEINPSSPTMVALMRARATIFEEELARDYAALEDGLDPYSTNVVVELDGEIIAGVRFTVRADGPLEDEAALRLDVWSQAFADYEIGQCSRLFVVPDYRGGDLVARLVAHLRELAAARGVVVVFIDCEPRLVDYYRHFGFTMFCPGYIHSVLGVEYVPLVSLLNRDRPGLEKWTQLQLATPSYDGAKMRENELPPDEVVLASRATSLVHDV